MKKTVRKNVSVKVKAPAFLVAKLDRLAPSPCGRSEVILFLLQEGLIDLCRQAIEPGTVAMFPVFADVAGMHKAIRERSGQ